MKANELRIGNLVAAVGDVFGEVIKLDALQVTMLNFPYTDIITFSQPADVLSPIPLTEEWLVKFGLSENSLSDRYSKRYDLPNDSFVIHLGDDSEHAINFEGNTLTYINHVHQLQNLYFALTGEELTIKDT